MWNIPQGDRANVNIKKTGEYYVRIETISNKGLKLVGNVGPFAIHLDKLQRREDPNDKLQADLVIKPNGPPVPNPELEPEPEPLFEPEPQPEAQPELLEPVRDPAPTIPVDSIEASPSVDITVGTPPTEEPAPIAPVNIPGGSKLQVGTPPNPSEFPLPPKSSTPKDLGLTEDSASKPPVTEIAASSAIPNKYIVAGAVAGGAAGLGILGGTFFGNVGTALGAVVGGAVGGLAVAVSYLGIPV